MNYAFYPASQRHSSSTITPWTNLLHLRTLPLRIHKFIFGYIFYSFFNSSFARCLGWEERGGRCLSCGRRKIRCLSRRRRGLRKGWLLRDCRRGFSNSGHESIGKWLRGAETEGGEKAVFVKRKNLKKEDVALSSFSLLSWNYWSISVPQLKWCTRSKPNWLRSKRLTKYCWQPRPSDCKTFAF